MQLRKHHFKRKLTALRAIRYCLVISVLTWGWHASRCTADATMASTEASATSSALPAVTMNISDCSVFNKKSIGNFVHDLKGMCTNLLGQVKTEIKKYKDSAKRTVALDYRTVIEKAGSPTSFTRAYQRCTKRRAHLFEPMLNINDTRDLLIGLGVAENDLDTFKFWIQIEKDTSDLYLYSYSRRPVPQYWKTGESAATITAEVDACNTFSAKYDVAAASRIEKATCTATTPHTICEKTADFNIEAQETQLAYAKLGLNRCLETTKKLENMYETAKPWAKCGNDGSAMNWGEQYGFRNPLDLLRDRLVTSPNNVVSFLRLIDGLIGDLQHLETTVQLFAGSLPLVSTTDEYFCFCEPRATMPAVQSVSDIIEKWFAYWFENNPEYPAAAVDVGLVVTSMAGILLTCLGCCCPSLIKYFECSNSKTGGKGCCKKEPDSDTEDEKKGNVSFSTDEAWEEYVARTPLKEPVAVRSKEIRIVGRKPSDKMVLKAIRFQEIGESDHRRNTLGKKKGQLYKFVETTAIAPLENDGTGRDQLAAKLANASSVTLPNNLKSGEGDNLLTTASLYTNLLEDLHRGSSRRPKN